jgi:HEAT repeat protein
MCIGVFAVVIFLSHVSTGFAAEPGVVAATSTTPEDQVKTPPDVAALMAAAESGKVDDRRHAIIALGHLGASGEPAVPLLIRILSNSNQELRGCAIDSLGGLGPHAKSAVPALVQLFEDKDTPLHHFHYWTVLALKKIGDQRAVTPLTAVLRSSSSLTAESALYAILDIGGQPAIPFLLQVLNEPSNNSWARNNAAYLLGECNEPGVIDAILAIATNHKESPKVRQCAIKALRRSSDPRVIEAATAVLLDRRDEREVRIGAARVLADLAGRDIADKLAAVARDTADDVQVRFWAAIDLVFVLNGKISDVEIVRALKGEPKMFVRRLVEGERFLRVFDARRAAFHALIDHGETPAVQSEARRLVRELISDVTPADSRQSGSTAYAWGALCFSVALAVFTIVCFPWLNKKMRPVTVFPILATITVFGMSIKAFYDARMAADPEWDAATTCEQSWVDDSCDDLPCLHPLEFRGEHYRKPPAYWLPEYYHLSHERVQQILTGGDGKHTTNPKDNDSNPNNPNK